VRSKHEERDLAMKSTRHMPTHTRFRYDIARKDGATIITIQVAGLTIVIKVPP
jgi:hypothetical protein